jgi:anti-sigma-K factor RskA
MNRETFLDLIPAYALGALDADEREAFEALLANDAEAQKLLAEYQALSDTLVLVTPAQPAPSHLQNDLRKRLAAQRKTEQPQITALTPPEVKAPRRNRTAAGLVALAAMLVAVVAVAWFLTRDQTLSPQELYARLSAQEGAISVAVVPDAAQEQISGTLIAAPDGSEAVIMVNNLPALSPDQTFQLWLISDQSSIQSGGLFQAAQTEAATYIVLPLESPLQDYSAFAVSIEPEGGSPFEDQPTTTPIFAVPVNA